MAGIMKTLWDESSELENEIENRNDMLSNDYVSDKKDELLEKEEEANDSLKSAEE